MKKYLAKSKLKSVYVENGKATKVFAKTYNKSDVLYEALNTSRVEDAGVNIPKLLEVAVTDGKWSITSEYVEGPTLTQLIEKYPDKADDYIKKMVEYQISFQKKSNPLLLVLKDKMNRQINSIEELDNSVKYELLTRLNSMKNHTKLCHGDYCPDNIIVTADAKGNIKENLIGEAHRPGRIEVVCGSMFSGKTEELIRRMKREERRQKKNGARRDEESNE